MNVEQLHGIAHDVRNDLMIIQAATRSLRRAWSNREADEAQASAFTPGLLFGALDLAVSHSAALLAGWSDSLHPNGGPHLSGGVADLPRALYAAGAAFQPCLSAGQRLDCEVFGRFSPLGAGSAELVAVLINLLKNAKEALDERPGRIVIRARALRQPAQPVGSCVRIVVADTGPGIRPDDLARATSFGFSTKGQGRGLGLWRARKFAEAAGGRLRLRSRPGRGTAAVLILPLDDVAPGAPMEDYP